MTSAEAFALVQAARGPHDLFGADAARAFAKLTALWRQHQDGHAVLVARGDIANLYQVADGLLKLARDPADNDLIRAETIALAALRTRVEPRFQAYFPRARSASRPDRTGRAWPRTCWARRSCSGRSGRPRPTSTRRHQLTRL